MRASDYRRRPAGRFGAAGLRALVFWMGCVAAWLGVFGAALQALRGDRWRATAPFAFGVPPALVALLALTAALCWLLARRRRPAAAALVAALAAAAATAALDYRAVECAPAAGAARLATWNVQRGWSAERARRLRSLDADVVVLIEAGTVGAERWSRALPGYALCAPGGGIVVLSRRPFVSCRAQHLTGASRAVLALIAGGPAPRVLAVDVDGDPVVPRRRALAVVAELARRDAGRTFVLGDFNTPRRAWGFDPLRATHVSAFAVAGSGWAGTWPARLPLLDLDQIWLPRTVEASCARVLPPAGSDHRPVIVDLPPAQWTSGGAATIFDPGRARGVAGRR